MKKRVLSFVLAILMALTVSSTLYVPEVMAADGITAKVSELKVRFPHGKFWNHYVTNASTEAGLLSKYNNKKLTRAQAEKFQNSVTSHNCATHNANAKVDQYECNFFDGAIQCYGFANKIFYEIFGVRQSTLSWRTDTKNIQAGDLLKMPGNPWHYAVCIRRDGNYLYLVEANYHATGKYPGENCMIYWNRKISVSQVTSFKHASNYDKVKSNTSNTKQTASTLAIGSGTYKPVKLTEGQYYTVRGKITSNYNITSVTVGIYTAAGKAKFTAKRTPNAKSFDIYSVDSLMKFKQLTPGSYVFKVVAADASGKTKTLVNNAFTVIAKSTLKIGSGKYNPGTLKKGSYYSVSGKITSNYKLTSVTVGIYTSAGKNVYVKTVNPNAKSYDIHGVDSYMKFSKLGKGTYKFIVKAKDASGTVKTLVNKSFTVK